MFSKLEAVENRYEQVQLALQRPGVASQLGEYKKLMKELSDLEKVVTLFRAYRKDTETVRANKGLLAQESDHEMRELLKEEIHEIESRLPAMEQELKILLIPKDPNDDKNILIEIRAGA